MPNSQHKYWNENINLSTKNVERAGYEPGGDFMIAMDAASSEWKGEKKGEYILPKAGTYTKTLEHK